MAIQTTSNLTNAVGTRYTTAYQEGAYAQRLYDQLAMSVGAPQFELENRRGLGSTYTFNFLSRMTPGTQVVSEDADIALQVLRDATSTLTPTSRADGMKWSQLLDLSAYTDYGAQRYRILGQSMMETVDNQAKAAALQGTFVSYAGAHVTRATQDAGTTTDNWTEAAIWRAMSVAESLHAPVFVERGVGMRMAIGHTDAYYDLFHGGNVISAIIYGGLPGVTMFNGELGTIANCKLLISPFAKVFGAAGAANGTSAGYTTSAVAKALDLTVGVTTGTNVGTGRLLLIGTIETANTHYDDNERVKVVSGTTTATIIGSGENGGLAYDHAAGVNFDNHDHVYPVAYGTPNSLVKVFANEVGEFGEIVGPNKTGSVEQWQTLAWKWFGGYGRMAENRIVRGEYSSSLDG
jgi:N4-gp56 family major capsid protein